MPEERTRWTSSIANQGTWVDSSALPTPSPAHLRGNLVISGTSQDQQALKRSLTAMGLGRHGTYKDLLRTERVGFEPTRVLPLHDFESCAFNRALPPLQALEAQFHFSRQPSHILSTQPDCGRRSLRCSR